jgi:hypothetical protein
MFFGAKLVAIFLGAVLILLGTVYFMFLSPMTADLEERVRDEVASSVEAVFVLNQSDAMAVRRLVVDLATQRRLGQAADCNLPDPQPDACAELERSNVRSTLDDWYRGVHAQVEAARNLHPGARGAERAFVDEATLLIIAQPDGTVVGRSIGDVADWFGPNAPNLLDERPGTGEAGATQYFPSYHVIRRALDTGRPQHDIIAWREAWGDEQSRILTLVAATPVHSWLPGGGLGPVSYVALIGFPVSDQLARDAQTVLGQSSLVYTLGTSVVGTSLPSEVTRRLQSASYRAGEGAEPMSWAEFLSPDNNVRMATAQSGVNQYVVARGGFGDDRAGREVAGFVVVASLTEAMATTKSIGFSLPVLGILILVFGMTALVLIVSNFVKPLIKIDYGLQQVILGNTDYIWEIDSKNSFHCGMAYSLNVMSAFLQGKPLPDEEVEEDDSEWAALLQFADVEVTGSQPNIALSGIARAAAGVAAAKHDETIDQHRRRIFDEYIAARKRVGSKDDSVTYDKFVNLLKKNAETFKKKHKCKEVRFTVVVKDGQVLLKPVPVE